MYIIIKVLINVRLLVNELCRFIDVLYPHYAYKDLDASIITPEHFTMLSH